MKNRAFSFITISATSFVRAHRAVVATVLGCVLFSVSAVAMAGITYESSETAGSSEVTYTSITVPKPSSVASGDLLLASIAVNGGDAAVVSLVPSGWTLIASTTNDSKLLLLSYYKIAGGSEGSNYEWRVNGSRTGAGGITRYSGVDAGNPIDAHDGNGNYGLGTTATTSVISTTVASTTIVALFAVDEGKPNVSSYFDQVTGMTERYERKGTDIGPTIALDDVVQVATGTIASKSSSIGGNNKPKNWASQVIALKPKGLDCTGGTITYVGGNTIHTFTSSGTLDCTAGGDGNANALVVAGGGGGGTHTGGGGGAGGVIYGTGIFATSTSYVITVGNGGAANTNGEDSSALGTTSLGGGYGGNGINFTAGSGGSGGGAIGASAPGSGTVGQGNDGGTAVNSGAGGGGAGTAGQSVGALVGGNGGDGLASSISGTSVMYGGGGGGSANGSSQTYGVGGAGGGGDGRPDTGSAQTGGAGAANSGGGGGGGSTSSGQGGAGGSGIVIISYPTE